MAPVQNTFTIIPNAPSAINGNLFNGDAGVSDGRGGGGGGDVAGPRALPPMTTKQAKKAYREKNKGPKMSKAERRRQELFEQDRIRREFEKERNQARARAARDKKKEKEEQERAEKRKKGHPLVDVRPSQDTIARFVRPVGAKRKTEASAEVEREPEAEIASVMKHVDDEDDNDNDRRVSCTPSPPLPPLPDLSSPKNGRIIHENSKDESTNRIVSDSDARDTAPPSKKRRTETPPAQNTYAEPIQHSRVVKQAIQPTLYTDTEPDFDAAITPARPINPMSPTGDAIELPKPVDVEIDDVLADELVCQQLLSESSATKSSPSKENESHESPARDKPPSPTPPKISSPTTGPSAQQPEAARDQPIVVEEPPRPPTLIHPDATVVENKPQKGIASNPPRGALRAISSNEANARNNITPSRHYPMPSKQSNTPHLHPMNPPKYPARKPFAPVSGTPLNSRPQNATPIAPPPRPPKFKAPTPVAGVTDSRPKFIKKNTKSNYQPMPGSNNTCSDQNPLVPPSSTQAFVYNHLDDFFPSPSQEVRELYEDSHASFGTSLDHKMRQRQASKSISSAPSIRQQAPKAPALPTAPAQRHRVGANNETSKSADRNNTVDIRHQDTAGQQSCKPHQVESAYTVDIPFFSTQDFILSQDWMDDMNKISEPIKQSRNVDESETQRVLKEDPVHAMKNGPLAVLNGNQEMSTDIHDQEPSSRPEAFSSVSGSVERFSGVGDSLKRVPALHDHSRPTLSIHGRQDTRTSAGGNPTCSSNNTKTASDTISRSAKEGFTAALPVSRPATAIATIGRSGQSLSVQPITKTLGNQSSAPPPRPSPKPLFASSNPNRDFRSKYLMERNSSAVWEGSTARRKVQEDVDRFNREEEAAERLLMEYAGDQPTPRGATVTDNQIGDRETGFAVMAAEKRQSGQLSPKPRQASSEPRSQIRQTVNQLPRTKGDVRTLPPQPNNQPTRPGASTNTQGRRQRRPPSRPGSSYQEMLALLEKSQPQSKAGPHGEDGVEQQHQSFAPGPVASQETDYGDPELEDSFRELL